MHYRNRTVRWRGQTLNHSIERGASKLIEAVAVGWPKVISNLKSLLETGAVVVHDSY